MQEANKTAVLLKEWSAYKSCLEEAFEKYVNQSSALIRQLALAGIAVVWVFRETAANGAVAFAPQLRWAAIFFVITLALDLAHYIVGIFRVNGRLDDLRAQEKEVLAAGNAWPHSPSSPPPDLPEAGTKHLFWLKALAIAIGSSLLLHYLGVKI